MRDGWIRRVVLALLLMSPASTFAGKVEWEDVTESDWAVSEDSANNILDAVILFEKITENDEDFQKDKCYRTEYRRIRILSDNGREWGDVEVPIYRIDQKVKDIFGRTIQRDGTILELQPDQIFEKEVVKTEGEKVKQTMFSLPGVTNDCIVEYLIHYELKSYVPGWVAQKEIAVKYGKYRWILAQFEFEQYVVDYLKTLEPADDFTVPNYIWLNTTKDPEVTSIPNAEKAKEIDFEIHDIPPFKSEPYSVPDASLKTRVITYLGCGAAPSTYWGSLSARYDKGLNEFCKQHDRLKEVVAQFDSLATDQEKIDAAYHWLVENTTNLSYYDLVEVNDKGEKKYKESKALNCVDDVLKYGYGNRTAINCAFIDMLRLMNIEAKLCWAKDRYDDLFIQQAKYRQFDNSLVAVVTSPGKYDFYSPGHALTPPGMIPWFLEGVHVMISGADDFLKIAPFAPSTSSTTNTSFTYRLDDDLNLTGTMDSRMTGHDARRLRIAAADEEDNDVAVILKEKLEGSIPNAELDSVSYENISDIYKPLKLRCTVRYPALSETGNRILIKPCDYLTEFTNPFYTDKRENHILLSYGHEQRESAQIEIPEGWTVEALPSDSLFKSPIGSCGIQFTNFGNTVAVQRTFVLTAPYWNVKSYSAVRSLYQTAADFDNLIVVLAKSPGAGVQGNVSQEE